MFELFIIGATLFAAATAIDIIAAYRDAGESDDN